MNGRVGNCTRFLHQGKELAGPENNEVNHENITLVFNPTEILIICDSKGMVAKIFFVQKKVPSLQKLNNLWILTEWRSGGVPGS